MSKLSPKEKANQLVNMFFNEMQFSEFVDDLDASKQCVKMLVNEIINLDYFSIEGRKYWEQVKQEIENL